MASSRIALRYGTISEARGGGPDSEVVCGFVRFSLSSCRLLSSGCLQCCLHMLPAGFRPSPAQVSQANAGCQRATAVCCLATRTYMLRHDETDSSQSSQPVTKPPQQTMTARNRRTALDAGDRPSPPCTLACSPSVQSPVRWLGRRSPSAERRPGVLLVYPRRCRGKD